MLRDPAEYVMRQYRMYGELSGWNSRHNLVFVFGPAQIKAVFSKSDVFIADAFRAIRIPAESSFLLLSNGLLRLNVSHRRHRRIMRPAFAAKRVSVHHDTIVELAEEQLDPWRAGDTIDLGREVGR
jgi:cytochrome P450